MENRISIIGHTLRKKTQKNQHLRGNTNIKGIGIHEYAQSRQLC